MVMRKQTTASPAKMPMKTERMRKKRSSSKESCAVMRRRRDAAREAIESLRGGVAKVVAGVLIFLRGCGHWPRQEGRRLGELAGRRETAIAVRRKRRIQT